MPSESLFVFIHNKFTADYNIFDVMYCFCNFVNSNSLIFGSIPKLKILFQVRNSWKRKAHLPKSVLTINDT